MTSVTLKTCMTRSLNLTLIGRGCHAPVSYINVGSVREFKRGSGDGAARTCSLCSWPTHIATMLLSVAIISVCLVAFILKYVFSGSGPNPFETDTREPLKKMVHDRKEKNKVLKQGESKGPAGKYVV